MKKISDKIKALLYFLVFAGLQVDNPASGVFTTSFGTDFQTIFTRVITIFLGLIGLVCIAYIMYGGYLIATSRGNAETAGAGKKTLTNAIIGLMIVLLSYVIVNVVTNAAFGKV